MLSTFYGSAFLIGCVCKACRLLPFSHLNQWVSFGTKCTCYLMAVKAILIYEYFLTFVYEVQRFWRVGRLNWASGLFYANRYLALFGHIPVMIEYFWSSTNPSKPQVSFISSLWFYLFIWIFSILDVSGVSSFGSVNPDLCCLSCGHLQSYHQYFAVVIQVIVSGAWFFIVVPAQSPLLTVIISQACSLCGCMRYIIKTRGCWPCL